MAYVDINDPNPGYTNSDKSLVRMSGSVGDIKYPDITTKEVVVGETILQPTLMTSITFQSAAYTDIKNFSLLKNKDMIINFRNGWGKSLNLRLKVFRLDNRTMMPLNLGRTEEFTVHACHETMIQDAKHLMSKSWKCTNPSDVVGDALQCVGAMNPHIGQSGPRRDYIAENIHPFQVIQQQCNAAVDGDDPSFVHYMTYEGVNGKHHFRSLKNMIDGQEKKVYEFRAAQVGVTTNTDYNNSNYFDKVIVFDFPCMFDFLTDLLNGVDEKGNNINSSMGFNFVNMAVQALGGATQLMQNECFEGGNIKQVFSNNGGGEGYGCNPDIESTLLKRQARMALLERDKIALRLTVPWSPEIHAGDKIRFNWFDTSNSLMPESGAYIVTSLTHKIQFGGFSTTSLDCIKTVY